MTTHATDYHSTHFRNKLFARLMFTLSGIVKQGRLRCSDLNVGNPAPSLNFSMHPMDA